MKKKDIYLWLNFAAPGIGQLAMKRYFRGTMMLGGAVLCFLFALWQMLRPILLFISMFLYGPPEGPSGQMDFNCPAYYIKISLPVAGILALWIWSIVDVIFFKGTEDGGEAA